MDFSEEDNNPFSGTSHLFASGISRLNDDFSGNNSASTGFYNGFMDSSVYGINEPSGSLNGIGAPDTLVHEQFAPLSSGDFEVKQDIQDNDEQHIPQYEHQYEHQQQQSQHVELNDNDYDESTPDDTVHSVNVPVYLNKSEYNYNSQAIGITITDAGHVRDNKGTRVIGYTISYNGLEIKRRYSEFDSLRSNLIRLFPTLIIPSIPEKHSIVKYFINPLNAKNDLKIIEKRKRLLTQFLQKCITIPQIRDCFLFQQFLTPNVDWSYVLSHPPITILPSSNLLAPPLNPTKPSPLHLLLPIPQSSSITNYRPREEDKAAEKEFQEYNEIFKVYKDYTTKIIKNVKKQKRHFKGYIKDLGELGAYYNAFSLEDRVMELSLAIEKTGQAIDINYLNSEAFNFKILTILEEPIADILHNSNEALNVLHFRKLKVVQLFIINTTIKRRSMRLDNLKNAKEQAARLEEILKKNAEQSPTIAAALNRLENGESIKKISPWQKFINGNSSNSSSNLHEQDISNMNDIERNIEMEKLEKELVKLNDCLRVILKDLEQVDQSIKENIDDLLKEYNKQWKEILRNYSRSVLIWAKDNLKSWEDAKAEVERIQVKAPTEIS